MLICVGGLFGVIFGFKAIRGHMIAHAIAAQPHIFTVSTMTVAASAWQPKITAIGSTRAIEGVNVTTELAGLVQKIYFKPGATVQKGEVLVQLNADPDIDALHSLEANAELAKITYDRDKAQYAIHAVSKATLDNDVGNLKSLDAQVAEQAATVAKKTIRAPFAGRLGISAVNLGEYLNTGATVVTLQTLNPIWVDFYLPQQDLAKIKVGIPVTVTTDGYPGKTFTGKITTINPIVETGTRNVEVEATIDNPTSELIPGMFTQVAFDTGAAQNFLTLPQTAVNFNSYGDIVYIVTQDGVDKNGKPILIANQKFVVTGDTRGEQVAILQGLKAGETVVTAGQLKLKNGSQVAVNNSVQMPDSPTPNTPDGH